MLTGCCGLPGCPRTRVPKSQASGQRPACAVSGGRPPSPVWKSDGALVGSVVRDGHASRAVTGGWETGGDSVLLRCLHLDPGWSLALVPELVCRAHRPFPLRHFVTFSVCVQPCSKMLFFSSECSLRDTLWWFLDNRVLDVFESQVRAVEDQLSAIKKIACILLL